MPTNNIDAWSVLAAEASAFGRSWGRYGAPSDAVEFRTEAEASLPSPAVFAAGPHGALLHVRLLAALPMTGELQKPGEMEVVPPRNSCFRVKAVHRDVVVADEHGRPWERSVVEVVQVAMGAVGLGV